MALLQTFRPILITSTTREYGAILWQLRSRELKSDHVCTCFFVFVRTVSSQTKLLAEKQKAAL